MPDQTWQEIAACIPPWDGCKTDDGDFVVAVLDGGRVQVRDESWDDHPETGREPWALFVPGLTHPPTAREAVARLALFLGAPEEAVDECVAFWSDWPHSMTLAAGVSKDWGDSFSWMHEFGFNEKCRPLAIATAWREARKMRDQP